MPSDQRPTDRVMQLLENQPHERQSNLVSVVGLIDESAGQNQSFKTSN